MRWWIAAGLCICGAVACGASDDDGASAGPGGAAGSGGVGASGGSGGGGWPDGGGGAAGAGAAAGAAGSGATAGTGGAPPNTKPFDPCASAECWNGPTLGACGDKVVNENFSSGSYALHRYLLMAPAGVEVELTATGTAGTWDPTLVVHDEQGVTVFDGTDVHSTAALSVTSTAPGANAVGVKLTAKTRMHLSVFLTGKSVVSSGFSTKLPTDAKYTLNAKVGCAPVPALTVRGVKLDSEQDLWVRYVAVHVVPKVPGTAAQRIDKSAYVTWWALKEGVINVNNPLSYSNCSIPPDKHIGPLEICPNENNAWQVGLSGVQAAYRTLASVEKIALTVFPQKTIGEMLSESAVTAGFGVGTPGTVQGTAIANADDRLRLSWLLRHSPIGFEAQYPPVYDQCFVNQKAWCFGTGWASSANFAPTQADAKVAVADLKSIFQTLGP